MLFSPFDSPARAAVIKLVLIKENRESSPVENDLNRSIRRASIAGAAGDRDPRRSLVL